MSDNERCEEMRRLTAAVIAFDGAQYLRAALPASWRVWVADGQIHVTDAAGRVRR